MAVYDSAKIRNVATLINKLVSTLDADAKPDIRAAAEHIDSFHGKTARAMEEGLERLIRTANGLGEEMSELASRINAYADLLEQADEQLAQKL